MNNQEVDELIALLLSGKTYISGNPSAGAEEQLFWNKDRQHFEWWMRYPDTPMADDPLFCSEEELRERLLNTGPLSHFMANLC